MKRPFALPAGTRLHITSTSSRREKHGTENVPAIDVRFRLDASNDILGIFDASLKKALYFKGSGANASQQGTLEGVDEMSDLPNKRFPDMGVLPWEMNLQGYTLRIPNGKDELALADCKLNKFTAELVEGGSCIVRFRLQKSGLDKNEMGTLNMMIDADVKASLLADGPGEQGSVMGDVEPLGTAEILQFRQPPAAEPKAKESPGKKAAATRAAKKEAAEANKQAELLKAKRIQYRNPATGETWSGKGLQPKWVKVWLASGRGIDQLEVKPDGDGQDATAAFIAGDGSGQALPPANANGAEKIGEPAKVQLSSEAAWPFPKGSNGDRTPPPQSAMTEGQTPAQVKKLAAAKAAKTRSAKVARKGAGA